MLWRRYTQEEAAKHGMNAPASPYVFVSQNMRFIVHVSYVEADRWRLWERWLPSKVKGEWDGWNYTFCPDADHLFGSCAEAMRYASAVA